MFIEKRAVELQYFIFRIDSSLVYSVTYAFFSTIISNGSVVDKKYSNSLGKILLEYLGPFYFSVERF